MRKLKLFLTLMLVAFLGYGQMWAEEVDFTAKGYSNQQAITSVSGTDCTITFDKGSNSQNAPKYFTSGTAIRAYGGNTMTVASTTKTIESIAITFGSSDGSNEITTNVNTYSAGTWTGSASSVTFTIGGTTGNRRLAKVTVTYATGGDPDPDPDPDPQTGDSYELVTDASKLAIGNEIIIVNLDGDKALSTTQNTNNRGAVDVTVSNNAIVPGVNVQVLTLGKTNNHWTLYTGNGYLYAAASDKNNMKTQTTNDANGEWTISIAEDGTVTAIAQGTNTRNELRYNPNNGNPIFSCYGSTSSMGKVKIYKKAGDAPTVAKPTISGEDNFLTSTTITLTQDDADHIYYTTNGNAPTTGSTEYTAPFVLTANATVKAIAVKGTETSDVAEKAFTKATVMTVAQARAAIDAGGDLSNKYVAGIISQVDSYNSTYHSITYWISDDGSTTNQLEVYSGLAGVVKTEFAAVTDLAVGDDVTVKGTLKKYNSTYEFDKNNTIEAYKPIARLAWSAASFDASLEGENSFPTLTSSVTVSYSSSNTDAATINPATGAITLKAVGSTTITASFAGSETIKANSASYELTIASSLVTLTYNVDGGVAIDPVNVNALPNPLPTTTKVGFNFGGWFTDSEKTIDAVPGTTITENTTHFAKRLEPYNITEAKSVIDNNQSGIANQYVAGIISQVDSYNNTYKSITYWISDDGSTTNQIQVYSGKIGNAATALSKEDFSAKEDLQVGDIVVVTGTLKKYGETYEFDKNNTIYSFNRPAPKYTVRFWNSEGWDNVYAFVWDNTQAYEGDWPGLNITSQIEGGWHYYQIEEGRNIIFTAGNSGPQTVDINDVQANACYVLGEGTDELGHKNVVVDNDCDDRLYVAGNAELTGESWNTTADRLVNGSITFTNVPAGNHEFKITNGTWKWNVGAGAFDSENSNVENWGTDNVGFTTDAAKDITIAYDKVNNKITVTAVDYVEPVYKAIVVAYGGKYYAMTKTAGNNGFAPLEVTVDSEGNVIVPSQADSISIIWKFNEGTGTASFQAGTDYLAGNGTSLNLQTAVQDWTLDTADEYYYMMDGTTKRSFFYQTNDNGGIFKNYAVSNFSKTGFSGAHTLYAADKVKVSKTVKVRFYAPVAWETVYAFTWGGTDNGDHQMTAVEEGSRWFEGYIEKNVPFLFYNGNWENLNQTEDHVAINTAKCFAWSTVSTNGKYNVAEITTCDMIFSIAGDEALTGVAEWGHTALVNNEITFNEVAANTYKFKITNGTWDWNLGAANVDADACQNVTIEETDTDGNVIFTVADESNITIAFNLATEKISIVATVPTPKVYYTKVTTNDALTAGTYLIVYEGANVAFDGGLGYDEDHKMDVSNNTVGVTINEGKIEATDQMDAAAFVIDPELGTIKSASGKYIGISGTSNGLKSDGKIYTYPHIFSIDDNGNAVIAANSTMVLRYNNGSTQNRFRYYGGTQQAIQLYKKAGDVKPLPVMTFAESAVETIKGEDFTAPVLNSSVDVTYESSATSKATVDETTGEVTIKNAGEVTIYAVSAATELYRECYAKYTISISAYETIREELEVDRYYTICMEKNITAVKNASFWTLSYKNAEPATEVYLEEATTIEAGKPYIFQAGATTLDVIYGDDSEDAPVENGALRGTFEDLTVSQLAEKQGVIYLLIQNAIRPNDGNYLNAHRAYIDYSALTVKTPTPAPGRRVRAIPMQSNVVTGCEEINASETPVKMMIDGQLFIIRGEKMYDTTGRLVK